MPSLLSALQSESINLDASESSLYEPPHRHSNEKNFSYTESTADNAPEGGSNKKQPNGILGGGSYILNASLHSLPNGRSSGSAHSRDRIHSRDGSNFSLANGLGSVVTENGRKSPGAGNTLPRNGIVDPTQSKSDINGLITQPLKVIPSRDGAVSPERQLIPLKPSTPTSATSRHRRAVSASHAQPGSPISYPVPDPSKSEGSQQGTDRFSSASAYPVSTAASGTSTSALKHPGAVRLQHRHTLQVPRINGIRGSREFPWSNGEASDDMFIGNTSPTTGTVRRGSLSLVRRTTRSVHSDMYLDEIPQDEEMAKWTETVRQKRASRRKRKEEEVDDRVMVGTKVDVNHVNWVTAYNMLTGIRFTVSRTNAKLDRELTDQDFDARHKFSFDITGNELTPSAKYDFKFKDYAPWVFRHLRAKFGLDPADYLISLTSKYILSELGSPGKSGSFFYFSRDYKYIIKTIHHAEHKLLRKILRDYYAHIEKNPNTLISQFYGLHRVKIPYGRKIHFVVMNNLFPPHRDIHQTFDLKGSTIGRDFKEEELEKNPRATLKDLNWLRRGYHLEFGPEKKEVFIAQMERDVALLQRLKIMDYSLLVGIHDLTKGNEENLRDKTLQVFHPGGERGEEPQPNLLTRTPSKLENARKARELRQIIKREKPVPMDKSTLQMPDEIHEPRNQFLFYSDDGGFRATHEDGSPGEEIYYLGVIDCLTHYGFVKKAEHFWKGMKDNKSQISPIPPENYGERFIKFIIGITMTREEAERQSYEQLDGSANPRSSHHLSRTSTDRVMEKAEKQARKTEDRGASEADTPNRTLSAARSPSAERTNGIGGSTLPVLEEVGEGGSTGERSARSQEREETRPAGSDPEKSLPSIVDGAPPPTPPKDVKPYNKNLPSLPPLRFSDSPSVLSPIQSSPG